METLKQHEGLHVCEIGFNAGHSALVWLLGHTNSTLLSFDLGYHPYTRIAAAYLMKRYGGGGGVYFVCHVVLRFVRACALAAHAMQYHDARA